MKDFTQKLIVAVFALCTSSVAMAQDFSVDGYYYYINEDGVSVSFTQDQYQAWIDGVGTYTGDIVIPSEVTYEGTTYPVTCVLDYAFFQCYDVTSVTMPNSITEIGDCAFYRCTGLKTVVLEAPYISKIMDEAFYGCENLTTLQCNSYMPPALGEDVFVGVDKTTCQLLVQEESVEAYKATEEWCDFLNTTDVEKVKVEESGIAVENGRLINNGSGRIDVYSLSGAKVYSGNDAEVSLGAGYYIVKVGKKALKIAL